MLPKLPSLQLLGDDQYGQIEGITFSILEDIGIRLAMLHHTHKPLRGATVDNPTEVRYMVELAPTWQSRDGAIWLPIIDGQLVHTYCNGGRARVVNIARNNALELLKKSEQEPIPQSVCCE